MPLFKRSILFLYIVFLTAFLFSNIATLPIESNDNLYNKFIDFLEKNNCAMPKEIELPFSSTSNESFSYLSDPCQISNAMKDTNEAKFLCSEIFDVLRNITCFKYIKPLPKIINPLSQDICNDFKSMQNVFPKGEEVLSGKLVDGTLCKLLCSKDYEFLCKTLLWSYGIQAKIKSSLENSIKEKETTDKSITASKMDTKTIKVDLLKGMPSKQISKEVVDNAISDFGDKKPSQNVSNLSSPKSTAMSTLTTSSQTTSNKIIILTNSTLSGATISSTSMTKESTVAHNESESESENEKITNDNGVQSIETNQNLPSEGNDLEQNEVNVNPNVDNAKGTKNAFTNSEINANSLTSEGNIVADQNEKNIPLNNLPDKEKHTNDAGPEANINSDNFVPQDTEMDNELNNVDIGGEEKETKIKSTNVKTDDEDKKAEKPPLTDFESPLGSPDVDLKQTESTTLQMLPERDEEHQEDKEQEQYNDTENDGDYPKSEYDNSFNPPLKNKESNVKSSVVEATNQMSNSYDTFISSRNNIGRVPDDIQMISSFPEQEDSHFFFYFLSIVFILMGGYLIFHNKQKIIALIVEGRHERRRRSHGAGYKKLETK